MKISRTIILVADSLGVGELPDAAAFGDKGADTLGHIAQAVGGLELPNLERLGLGNLGVFPGLAGVKGCSASYGKMAEVSAAKDTTSGHWELMGLPVPEPFPTYPGGFPDEIIEPFKKAIGTDVLGNVPASGTEIIKELGEEHMRTGYPIVYTSADSVFQIAAHKDVVPLTRLYSMCEAARKILTGKNGVGRVIARPFVGEPGSFVRTHERRDFSLEPVGDTLLDLAKGAGLPVVGIGKIEDIFAGRGITEALHTSSNADGMEKTLAEVKKGGPGIIFTNLVEFDMLYGHRNDPGGYYGALRELDAWLPALMDALTASDMLMITADHGCDPTTPGTDHTREYVPLLVYGRGIRGGVDLGVRESFSDAGATIAEALGLSLGHGRSFLAEIKKLS